MTELRAYRLMVECADALAAVADELERVLPGHQDPALRAAVRHATELLRELDATLNPPDDHP